MAATFAYMALLCFSGGVLSALAGFGALVLIVPGFILLLGLGAAVPLGVLCGISTQAFNSLTYHPHVKRRPLAVMLLGSLPGVLLGGMLLVRLPETILRALLGLLLVFYVLWNLLGRLSPPERAPGKWVTALAGFVAGAFGGAFGICGPPVVVYATRTGWEPRAIRAFVSIYCFLLFIIIGTMQAFQGLLATEIWRLALLAVPACLAGCWCGRRLASRLRAEQYMRLVYLMLLVMGVSLCWPAFRTLFLS